MTARVLQFPHERVSDAETHEATIIAFPKKRGPVFGMRWNGWFYEPVLDWSQL